MKRVLGVLALSFLVAVALAGGAEAQKKQKKAAKKKAEEVPTSQEIAKSLAELRWGMSKDEVDKHFAEKIKAKYRPLIAKTKDAVEEDRLRQVAKQEMTRLREGYVEFTGRSTGWDVSFLKGEFTHNNDEAMLVVRDENSQNFYFFIGGKLWKWYKAFDAAVFPADNFNAFAAAVQRKFGNAKAAKGQLHSGAAERQWLEWQDDKTRLRAVDETDFYGFYSLVFEAKDTLANLARLRTRSPEPKDRRHNLVEAVLADGSDADPDDSKHIADRITGKIRQREDADEPAGPAAGKGKSKGKSTAPSSPVSADDDPLSGL